MTFSSLLWMNSICIAGGITDGKEEEMEGLELDKVEEIATQMDGEVPSMSGSHGNLSDRSHHGTVGRELRVVVTTGLAHFTFHFTSRQSILYSSRGVFGINTSRQCHHVKGKHAKNMWLIIRATQTVHTHLHTLPKIKNEISRLVRVEWELGS